MRTHFIEKDMFDYIFDFVFVAFSLVLNCMPLLIKVENSENCTCNLTAEV